MVILITSCCRPKIMLGGLNSLIRPINITAHNSLLLNLSMCNGNAVIREIDPKKRAPFRAVVGPLGEIHAMLLQESWEKFYDDYYNGIKSKTDFLAV